MDRRTVGEFFLILGVSALIGAVVALPFFFIGNPESRSIAEYLFYSALAGFTIGLIARLAFQLVFTIINRYPVFAFLAVAGVIALGTFGWGILIDRNITRVMIAVLAVAEAAGMTATLLFWRYTRNINRRLKETQEKMSVPQ